MATCPEYCPGERDDIGEVDAPIPPCFTAKRGVGRKDVADLGLEPLSGERQQDGCSFVCRFLPFRTG